MAKELASRKINLLLIARSENLLLQLTSEIRRGYGVQCYYMVSDLSRKKSAAEIFGWCMDEKFDVSILINNAGYGLSGSFDQRTMVEHIDMINVGLLSTLSLVHAFIPHLKKYDKAYILNIGSSSAYQAVPYMATYAAAKSFIVSFTRALKYELRNSNVAVSVVSPGVTDTDFPLRANVPAKGLRAADKVKMSPEDVAKIAINSMFNERTEVLTGLITKATIFFVKLLPKRFTERTAAKFYQ